MGIAGHACFTPEELAQRNQGRETKRVKRAKLSLNTVIYEFLTFKQTFPNKTRRISQRRKLLLSYNNCVVIDRVSRALLCNGAHTSEVQLPSEGRHGTYIIHPAFICNVYSSRIHPQKPLLFVFFPLKAISMRISGLSGNQQPEANRARTPGGTGQEGLERVAVITYSGLGPSQWEGTVQSHYKGQEKGRGTDRKPR